MGKPILCLDFDGVIHSYTTGWIEPDFIPDPPVPGAFHFIHDALQHFTVKIFSSRSNSPAGIRAMQLYVQYWALRELGNAEPLYKGNAVVNKVAWNTDAWPTTKPSAFLTIDDRALRFTGNWADFDLESLLAFKPWNKQ